LPLRKKSKRGKGRCKKRSRAAKKIRGHHAKKKEKLAEQQTSIRKYYPDRVNTSCQKHAGSISRLKRAQWGSERGTGKPRKGRGGQGPEIGRARRGRASVSGVGSAVELSEGEEHGTREKETPGINLLGVGRGGEGVGPKPAGVGSE